ncbi:hypothetical protein C8F04DRAFT_1091344 [Mycena alexandri]|uniref:Uncharacterized protein n=1 Tax=Mycena alexandri TaxID=1745969 RepID=A0AAD6XA41_9AGAR|nr:hypothetical protein C8F04DRAFT_1091344 [Mycena alexandri]
MLYADQHSKRLLRTLASIISVPPGTLPFRRRTIICLGTAIRCWQLARPAGNPYVVPLPSSLAPSLYLHPFDRRASQTLRMISFKTLGPSQLIWFCAIDFSKPRASLRIPCCSCLRPKSGVKARTPRTVHLPWVPGNLPETHLKPTRAQTLHCSNVGSPSKTRSHEPTYANACSSPRNRACTRERAFPRPQQSTTVSGGITLHCISATARTRTPVYLYIPLVRRAPIHAYMRKAAAVPTSP